MDHTGLSDDQLLKGLLRRALLSDLTEIKEELRQIRSEIAQLSSPHRADELLTMEELCAELKLSRPSIYKLIREKKTIKPVQLLDQDLRFRRSDITDLIKNSYQKDQG